MKMSEKVKIEEEDERTIPIGGRSGGSSSERNAKRVGSLQASRLVHKTRRDVEERFFLMTKILDFAAICNRRGFSEWTHPYGIFKRSG